MRKLLFLAPILIAIACLAIAGSGSSASQRPAWAWQNLTLGATPTPLVSTSSGGDRIDLSAVTGSSGTTALVVDANGEPVQQVPGSSLSNENPIASFVVADSAGTEAIVGLARGDVARILLTTDHATFTELPVNSAGAFAAPGVSLGANVELAGVAADGSTIARVAVTAANASCGGAFGPCSVHETEPPPPRVVAGAAAAPLLYAIREYSVRRVTHNEVTRLDPATLVPRGRALQLVVNTTGAGIGTIALSPDSGRIAVALLHGGTIRIVDLSSLRVSSAIPTRSGVDVRAMAWLDKDHVALVAQKMSKPYQRNVIGRWLIRIDVKRRASIAMSLPKKAMLQYATRAGSGFVIVLHPNNLRDRRPTVVAAYPGGRTFLDSVLLPPPVGTWREDRPVASADGSHLYFVRTGGQIVDLDIATHTTTVHQVRAPSDAPNGSPPSSVVLAETIANGLVISGVFTLEPGGQRAIRTGVYLVDTATWRASTLDPARNLFMVYGDKIATLGSAPIVPMPTPSPTHGSGVSVFQATDGQRLYHVFGAERIGIVRLIGNYGHALTPAGRLMPGARFPQVFLDRHFDASSGAGMGRSRPPLNGLRLIYRGSPDIQEPGVAAGAVPHHNSPAIALDPHTGRVVQAAASYRISNRGRAVPARNPRRLFPDHAYRLFLLGTRNDQAYYRIQVAAHYTCWGRGPGATIGKLDGFACPLLVGAYPEQFSDNQMKLERGAKTPQYARIAGVVADQAASVALRDANGKTLQTAPVKDNLFAFTPPFPKGFLRAVPLDVHGARLPPRPQWGQHQTPPTNLWGPGAVVVPSSKLGTVAARGEAKGVTVSVGANGVVVFDARAADASTRAALLGKNAWFGCIELSGQNVRHNRSNGITARFKPVVAFKPTRGLVNVRYDGCEAGGSYGHRWHDSRGPHSALEVAFTPQGARYFEDRATARDLAEFVRGPTARSLRGKTGSALIHALRAHYSNQIAVLASPATTAAPGRVGVWTNGRQAIFSERSHLGDRLYVQIEHGKIKRENVRGLAFVY